MSSLFKDTQSHRPWLAGIPNCHQPCLQAEPRVSTGRGQPKIPPNAACSVLSVLFSEFPWHTVHRSDSEDISETKVGRKYRLSQKENIRNKRTEKNTHINHVILVSGGLTSRKSKFSQPHPAPLSYSCPQNQSLPSYPCCAWALGFFGPVL